MLLDLPYINWHCQHGKCIPVSFHILLLYFFKGQEVCLGSNSSTALGCAAVGRADVGTWAWLSRAGRMGTVHRDLVLRALATFALLF